MRDLDDRQIRGGARGALERREQVEIMTRVLDGMSTRDREILRSVGKGGGIDDLATRLGITYEAAEIAKRRAVERLRAAFQSAVGPGGAQ